MKVTLVALLGLSLALAGCFSSTIDTPRGPKSADGVTVYPDGWLGDDLDEDRDDESDEDRDDEDDEGPGIRPIDGDDDEDPGVDEEDGDDDEDPGIDEDEDEDIDEEPVDPRPTGGTTGLLTGVWERVAVESAWGDRIESVGGDYLVFGEDTIAFSCEGAELAYSTSSGSIYIEGAPYEWLIIELLETRFTYMDGGDTYFYERRDSCE